MKSVFPKFILLAAALIVSACGSTASSQKGPVDEPAAPPPDLASSNANTSKASGYPKIASAVATAEIRGLDGSTYTINDKQGKVLLLNLWATWCGPCRSEIPALVRMQENHGPAGFEVIGLNTDEEEAQLINGFAAELKINYPIAYADTKMQSSMLKISKFPGIPQSFLIDREGRLRGVFRGANPADIATMEQLVGKVVNESESAARDVPPETAKQ
jgi:thiol-disulfide isomerase/thioredoxin